MNANRLTPAETERLALLAEECGEVIQVIGKILRHGYESRYPQDGASNCELLEKELGHVMFASGFAVANGDLREAAIAASTEKKAQTIGQWLHHQKS